ncbi:unnamed protein product [Blepharisma stoltei]|uniref:PX domain-containing protein n=1 Tax=Blepharisma stoltei TaxID=1481888 RepID=A0AAU9IQL7_9CILI|nr:unnamed protein product [Blepharisma stoltei]
MQKREIIIDKFLSSNPANMIISVESAEKHAEEGYTQYLIVLSVDHLEHVVYRRFSQFSELNDSIKATFPRVDLPDFPSKFSIYNRIEQRKKLFHGYLNGILKLCIEFPPLPRDTMMKILAEFLEIVGVDKKQPEEPKIPRQLRESFVDSSQVIQSSETGFVDIKFGPEDWQRHYASLAYSNLYLSPDDNESNFTHVISCFGANIVTKDNNILEINHDYQKFPILIRGKNSQNIQKWSKALVIAATAKQDSPLASYRIICAGRIIVKIKTGDFLKPLKPSSSGKTQFFVKVELYPFSFQTSVLPQEDLIDWNQLFVMPVMNRFFILNLSICYYSSDAWLKQHAKEEVLEEFSITINDISLFPFSNGPVKLFLNKSDSKRKKSADEGPSFITVELVHEASFMSMFMPPPSHFFEDTEIPEIATMRELKIASKRLKRVRILYIRFLKTIYKVFLWTYPRFSMVCLILFILLAAFLPAQYVVPLALFILLMFCLSLNPRSEGIINWVSSFFFTDELRTKPIPSMKTIKQKDHENKSKFTILKEKTNEGVMDRWKKFKEDAVDIQNLLIKISIWAEKTRQIFLWGDPLKSLYFCIGLIIGIYIFYTVPMRLVILTAGCHRFYKGRKSSKRRLDHNTKVCKEVLKSLYSQHLKSLSVKSTELWPSDIVTNPNLQKKIIETIRTRLKLAAEPSLFQEYPTPLSLFDAMRAVEFTLKLKSTKGERMMDPNKRDRSTFLYKFMMNIPSEYYRYLHPKLLDVEPVNNVNT